LEYRKLHRLNREEGVMRGRDNRDSIPTKGDSELKDLGRRQVLGVAVVAAAFTAGQVGSAEAQGKKKPPANKPTPGPHGGYTPPHDLPGAAENGYAPVSKFHDLAAKEVYADAANYRQMVSAYAKSLRQKLKLPDSEFRHVVRLEPVKNDCGPNGDPCCGCCCC
jgi:hypothetical protein